MTTIIDQSETAVGLDLEYGSTTIIQRDSGSTGPVVVKADEGYIGVGNVVLIQNDATLELGGGSISVLSDMAVRNGGLLDFTGSAQIGVLTNIDIEQGGTVELGTTFGIDIGCNLNFVGPCGTLKVDQVAQGAVLSPSTAGNIVGFGPTDTIDLAGVSGATHVEWTQTLLQQLLGMGAVELFNAKNVEVGSITIQGTYKTANFAITSDHHGGTDITFAPTH